MADVYLPHTVRHLPINVAMVGGTLRPEVAHYVQQGVVRVIAGPEACDLIIDVRRPYTRPHSTMRVAPTDA